MVSETVARPGMSAAQTFTYTDGMNRLNGACPRGPTWISRGNPRNAKSCGRESQRTAAVVPPDFQPFQFLDITASLTWIEAHDYGEALVARIQIVRVVP